jgi:hypothetical protein
MTTPSIRNWFYEKMTTEERLRFMKKYVPRRESYLRVADKECFPTDVNTWYSDTIANQKK